MAEPRPVAQSAMVTARPTVLGGLVVATGLPFVAVPLLDGGGRGGELVLGVLVVVIYTGHVAATAWLGAHREVRRLARARPVALVVAPSIAVGCAAVLALSMPRADLVWVLLAFFAWQFVHFQRQNAGLVSLVASTASTVSSTGLRRPERLALLGPASVAIAAFVTRPGLVDVKVVGAFGWLFPWTRPAMVMSVLWCLVVVARRPRSERPGSFLVAYVMATMFFVPVVVFGSAPAAVGPLVVAHGAQYLWLLTCIGVGATNRGEVRPRTRLAGSLLLADVVVVGGLVLAAASDLHRVPGAWARLGYGLYLGIVGAHFLADRVLWRLRDPRSRVFVAGALPGLFPDRPPTTTPVASAPLLPTTAHLLSTTTPLASTTGPLLSTTTPVLSTTAPMAATLVGCVGTPGGVTG